MIGINERDEDIVKLLRRLSKTPVNKWAEKNNVSKRRTKNLHEIIDAKIEEAFYYGKNT